MRVHSFLPIVALSLTTLAVADDDTSYFHGAIISNSSISRRAPLYPAVARSASTRRSVATICEDLPKKWSYLGCYNDDPSNRALTGPNYCDDTDLAEEKCIEFCDAKGYPVAGVEFGQECFCGYGLSASGTKASEFDCNMPCTGSSEELCGAGNRLNVFTNGDSAPTVLAQAGDYTSLGCYSDSASARTLTTRISLSGNVRVTDCTSACSAAGFPYAGLEFGDECFCGASLQNGGAPIADASCNMACTADKTQLCGGPAAINIYHSTAPVQTAGTLPAGWSSEQCYSDDVSHRTLSTKLSLDASTVTTETCIAACSAAGFTIAGLEYSSECFCGNSIENNAQRTTSGCDMACSGNRAETCGGAGHINIYWQKTETCNLPGCFNGNGVISTIYASLTECLAICNSRSDCLDIQYSHQPSEPNVCNLFNVPISETYAYGYEQDSYCITYSFYDKTCSAQ